MPFITHGLIFVFLWYIFFNFLETMFFPEHEGSASVSRAAGVLKDVVKRSDESLRDISVHEAGHVLALYLLPKKFIPDTLYVEINKTVGNSGFVGGGRLRFGFNDNNEPEEIAYVYFLLCCYRAGIMAERIVLDKQIATSSSDIHQWQKTAKLYCLHVDEYTYFVQPESKLELNVNIASLEKLRKQIDHDVTQLLGEHIDLLQKVASHLSEKGRLEREEILSLLNIT